MGNEHGRKMSETEPSEKKRSFFDSMMVYFTPAKVGFVQPLTKQTARPAKLMGQGDYLYYGDFFLGFGESHEVGPYQLEMDEMGLYLL